MSGEESISSDYIRAQTGHTTRRKFRRLSFRTNMTIFWNPYTPTNAETLKNAALIGGEGEGVNQRTTTIGEATGLQRYETYIDGSSVSSNGAIITEEQYYKLLQDYGKEQLNEVSDTESFEGNVVSDGNYKLNQDYFLGDLVQVKN